MEGSAKNSFDKRGGELMPRELWNGSQTLHSSRTRLLSPFSSRPFSRRATTRETSTRSF